MSTHDPRQHLASYLTDHHAGAVAARSLAQHCEARNEGNEAGAYLRATFIPELDEERTTLEGIMARVGATAHPVKDAFAWFGAQLERINPAAGLVGYSPLARVIELEALMLGVRGKRGGWVAMKSVAATRELADVDFDRLIAQAVAQEAALDGLRTQAAQRAFT